MRVWICLHLHDRRHRLDGMTQAELIQQHDANIRRILTRLQEFNLVADWDKTTLFVETVEFCGRRLRHGVREPQPGKLMPLEKWPLPRTFTALGGFSGFCNYYNEYVKDFAQYAGPLQEKLKVGKHLGKKGSNVAVQFTLEERRFFEQLKLKLLSGLSLQTVNPGRLFVLRCDASNHAIRATLEQLPSGGSTPTMAEILEKKTKPVAYMSCRLTPRQAAKWGMHEKETYAIICALKKYASWIGRQPVSAITDHSSLENGPRRCMPRQLDLLVGRLVGNNCWGTLTYMSIMSRANRMRFCLHCRGMHTRQASWMSASASHPRTTRP